jgi:hypothetical protein
MIIIDENVDQSLVTKLKNKTSDLISIREQYPDSPPIKSAAANLPPSKGEIRAVSPNNGG